MCSSDVVYVGMGTAFMNLGSQFQCSSLFISERQKRSQTIKEKMKMVLSQS